MYHVIIFYERYVFRYNIGFPIAECSSNGDFIITKPEKTGGLVSVGSVGEQLVYEIGDPTSYILPDVICDFSDVTIHTIPGEKMYCLNCSSYLYALILHLNFYEILPNFCRCYTISFVIIIVVYPLP